MNLCLNHLSQGHRFVMKPQQFILNLTSPNYSPPPFNRENLRVNLSIPSDQLSDAGSITLAQSRR